MSPAHPGRLRELRAHQPQRPNLIVRGFAADFVEFVDEPPELDGIEIELRGVGRAGP
jgi:hypothetical protein